MKLIIAGSRHLVVSHKFIEDAYDYLFPLSEYPEYPREIVCGEADGIDKCGKDWGERIIGSSIASFPADWTTHGKAAGPIRNAQMAEYGDILLLIWDGKSRGSSNMKKEMEKRGKPVKEVVLK